MLTHLQFKMLYSIGSGESSTQDMRDAWEAATGQPTRNFGSMYTIMRRFTESGLVQKRTANHAAARGDVTCNHAYYSLTQRGVEAVNNQIEFYKLRKLPKKRQRKER